MESSSSRPDLSSLPYANCTTVLLLPQAIAPADACGRQAMIRRHIALPGANCQCGDNCECKTCSKGNAGPCGSCTGPNGCSCGGCLAHLIQHNPLHALSLQLLPSPLLAVAAEVNNVFRSCQPSSDTGRCVLQVRTATVATTAPVPHAPRRRQLHEGQSSGK